MQINLSTEQAELMLELLTEKKHALSVEIAHTSRREFRQGLLQEEVVLDGLLELVTQARDKALQECR